MKKGGYLGVKARECFQEWVEIGVGQEAYVQDHIGVEGQTMFVTERKQCQLGCFGDSLVGKSLLNVCF